MEQQDYTQYLINYTLDAKAGKFPELVGREKELERLIHVLLRNTKNNPVVVGSAGIGKSALLKGLISFMASESAPEYSLDADCGGGPSLDNTEVSEKAVKKLVNGQLFIESNGHVYNAMGQMVK